MLITGGEPAATLGGIQVDVSADATRSAAAEAPSAASPWRARLVGLVTLALVLVFGEAALVAVTGVGRHLAGGANAGAWAIATVANATLAYVLVGLPQVRAWEKSAGAGAAHEAAGATIPSGAGAAAGDDAARDPRTRFATRTLSGGGLTAFVVASVVGGPLAVGWYYGRRGDPRARSLTWAAAWLLAAVWSAVYLGLLAWAL